MEKPHVSSQWFDRFTPNVEQFLDRTPGRLAKVGRLAARLVLGLAVALGADTVVGVATANQPVEVIELASDSTAATYNPNLVTLVYPTFGNRDNGCKAAEHSGAQTMGRLFCIKLSGNALNTTVIATKIGEALGLNESNAHAVSIITLAESTGGMVSYNTTRTLLDRFPGVFIPKGFIFDSAETGITDVAPSKRTYIPMLQITPGGKGLTYAQQTWVAIVDYKSNALDPTTWSNIARVTAQFSTPALRAQADFINTTKLEPDPRLVTVPVTYIYDENPANDTWVDVQQAAKNWSKLFDKETITKLKDIGHAGLVHGSDAYNGIIPAIIQKDAPTNPYASCNVRSNIWNTSTRIPCI